MDPSNAHQKKWGIKMHKLPGWNGNQNANETLWVLTMHAHALFACLPPPLPNPPAPSPHLSREDERQVSHGGGAGASF